MYTVVIFQFHASTIAMMESLGEFWWDFFNQIVPNAQVQSASWSQFQHQVLFKMQGFLNSSSYSWRWHTNSKSTNIYSSSLWTLKAPSLTTEEALQGLPFILGFGDWHLWGVSVWDMFNMSPPCPSPVSDYVVAHVWIRPRGKPSSYLAGPVVRK